MRTTSLFVDTSGWMAQLSPNEMCHDQANAELRQAILDLHITIYTTDQVLAEAGFVRLLT
jgi:hypothetical protein